MSDVESANNLVNCQYFGRRADIHLAQNATSTNFKNYQLVRISSSLSRENFPFTLYPLEM